MLMQLLLGYAVLWAWHRNSKKRVGWSTCWSCFRPQSSNVRLQSNSEGLFLSFSYVLNLSVRTFRYFWMIESWNLWSGDKTYSSQHILLTSRYLNNIYLLWEYLGYEAPYIWSLNSTNPINSLLDWTSTEIVSKVKL